MILALLLQAAELPAVPADWSALASLPYIAPPRITPDLTSYVAHQMVANHCPLPKPVEGHYVLKVEVATLVDSDGAIRRTVPHAISCPTVEQYAAGLVAGFARSNLLIRPGAALWYRATIVFDWQG